MFPKYFSASILLAIVGISSGLGDGYYNCPDDSKAVIEVGDIQKDVPPSIFGFVKLDIRVPESGLLDAPITCIVATDLSSDGSGGSVSLVSGGLGSKFAELSIKSELLRGLKYRVQVYTDAATTTAASTTSSS